MPKNGTPILLYHSIDTRAAPGYKDWALPPSLFSEHMSVLSREGYTTWTISQFVRESIIACQPPPEKTVVITFDDAFQDFADNALPVLAEHQFAVTLYVPTGCVGKTASWLREEGEDGRCLMGWNQLRELSATYPIEVGAHSCTHAHLDVMREADARREIEASKSVLEDHLGMSVTTFAYPYGHYDRSVRAWVEQAGFESASAVREGFSSMYDDRFALARITILGHTTAAELQTLLREVRLPVAPFPDPLSEHLFRIYRKVRAGLKRHRAATV